jgi:effector-binding domain-containing protein
MFDGLESFDHAPSQPGWFFSMDPKGKDEREEGRYLVGYANGYYGDSGGLPEKMMEYASKNRLSLGKTVYHQYLTDEVSEKIPENYLMQVSVRIVS